MVNIVIEYNNNTYHSKIKVKSTDVKLSKYIELSVENKNKDPKFKVGDHVRILTYKTFFAQGSAPNWSEEVFVIKKVTNVVVPWTYIKKNFESEEFVGTFSEKELEKANLSGFMTKN